MSTAGEGEEEDLEVLQAEIARMEAEAARIAQETEDLEKKPSSTSATAAAATSSTTTSTTDDTIKKDGHSIYVGQVDYSTTPEELLSHFESCGTVERVTIVCDKFTGKPKGFAYLEFQNDAAVENALKLDGSTFKERQLKVTPKRVNDPNFYGMFVLFFFVLVYHFQIYFFIVRQRVTLLFSLTNYTLCILYLTEYLFSRWSRRERWKRKRWIPW